MFAVIGLGNPGAQYRDTRHNVGFRVLEAIERRSGIAGSWQSKFGCLYQRASIGGKESLLVMPQKYMNLSGEASVPLLRYFRIEPKEIIVVHDDLDLDPGVIRCREGGSAAGHNGVQNIIDHLGENSFVRVRVGIGHPARAATQREADDVTRWVLSSPRGEERSVLEDTVERAADAVAMLVEEGLAAAQAKYHRREQDLGN